ncbi:MAG: sugar transferase [Candidatus Binatia bacterium]
MKPDSSVKLERWGIASAATLRWVLKALQLHYRQIIRLGQILLDFLTVYTANAFAYNLYLFFNLGKQHTDPTLYESLNLLVSVGAVLVFSSVGLYKETVGFVNIEETRKLIKGVFYAAITIFVISFFVREHPYSRITSVLAVPLNLILLYFQRLAISRIHRNFHRKGYGVRRCLVYGAGETGISIVRRLFHNRQLGWLPVGFLDDDPSKGGCSYRVTPGPEGFQLRVLGSWNDFEAAVETYQVNDLVVATPSDQRYVALERAMLGCQRQGIQYHFVPSAGPHLLPSLELQEVDGIPLFSPKNETPLVIYELMKRGFDVSLAVISSLFLLPVFAIIALLIKLDSRGSVVFRQKRTGWGGKDFVMYKFRTMHAETPRYASAPSSSKDLRVTRVGKFLRRTSLDELPQLINVVKGDMSLVGPRPEMPFIVASYNEQHRQRLNVKPGITGLWQISGDRALQIHENLEYDLYYIENRSFFLDLAILFQTLFSAFRGVGAW